MFDVGLRRHTKARRRKRTTRRSDIACVSHTITIITIIVADADADTNTAGVSTTLFSLFSPSLSLCAFVLTNPWIKSIMMARTSRVVSVLPIATSLMLLLLLLCLHPSQAFTGQPLKPAFHTELHAKASASRTKGKGTRPSSGFGGAAAEECPCGSGESYSKCCLRLHKSKEVFGNATAEEVVRARYSAYAKREVSTEEAFR